MDRSDGYWRVDTGDLTHPVDPFADEPRIPDAVSRSALKKGPEKAKSAKRERPSIVKSWWKEILTWLLATVALLTIVVLLAAFDGKLVRQWHSRVSINTMIAVLAQVEVSALMVSVQASLGQLKWIWFQQQRPLVGMETFDSATRGPEGSVKLLWKMRTSWYVLVNSKSMLLACGADMPTGILLYLGLWSQF